MPFTYWDSTSSGHPKRKKLKDCDPKILETAKVNDIWLASDGSVSPNVGQLCYKHGTSLGFNNLGIVTQFLMIDDGELKEYVFDPSIANNSGPFLKQNYRWSNCLFVDGSEQKTHCWMLKTLTVEEFKEVYYYFISKNKNPSEKFKSFCKTHNIVL